MEENKSTESFLFNKANYIRKDVLSVSVKNKAGHIAPSLSCVDILVALYYDALNYEPKNPLWEDRDRVIFSKAHGCYSLYSILADIGVIPKEEWDNFYIEKNSLSGCVERNIEYGLEAGCGSLGHGLPQAVGIAYGAKLQNKKYHTFCIAGDGEMQEGTTWEAIQFAYKHELDNITIIIDRNRLQAMDFIANVMDRSDQCLIDRFKGFGLDPKVCEGHNVHELSLLIKEIKSSTNNVPGLLIAQTIKGHGLKCMENVPMFHFRIPTEDELKPIHDSLHS